MPNNTKTKIITASVNLFNELGLANVRLQQIADEAGISVGNLAYHFRNKEAIVTKVYDQLFIDFSEILSYYLRTSGLRDLDNQLHQYFLFFQRYRFLIADLISKSSPGATAHLDRWNDFANRLLIQIRQRLQFYVTQGLLHPQEDPNRYDHIAKNIWRSIFFSIPEASFRGQILTEPQFKKDIWEQITPYFTPDGKRAFEESLSLQ